MTVLYLDVFSGISGDMFIGAMLDLGVDFGKLDAELRKLGLDEYHLHAAKGRKSSIEGTKFDVHLHDHGHGASHSHEIGAAVKRPSHEHEHEHVHEDGTRHRHAHSHSHSHAGSPGDAHETDPHSHEDHARSHGHGHGRAYADIKALIAGSGLSGWVKEKAAAIFDRVAVAEGKIHGMRPEEVHFHEVGAVDSIVDIVGACICLELLGRPRVLSGPVVEGTGWVDCAHGRFPVPTAATLEILGARGIALSQCEEPHELVTPTGAAILAELAEEFGLMRELRPARIGYGLGTRDNKTRPNVLRAVLGEAAGAGGGAGWEMDRIAVLETNLDDMTPELLGHFAEKALAAGALDVFQAPVQMKKNRSGVLLTILCAEREADRFAAMMLAETTAFGVRQTVCERRKLRREFRVVKTGFGEVTVKVGLLDGKVVQAAPEFESCKRLAEETGRPIREVFESARKRWSEEAAE